MGTMDITICAVVGLAIIGIGAIFKYFVNKISYRPPPTPMYDEYSTLMNRIQDAKTYHDVCDIEKDIDQFEYKYQSNNNCAWQVVNLFSELMEKKQAYYNAMMDNFSAS